MLGCINWDENWAKLTKWNEKQLGTWQKHWIKLNVSCDCQGRL